MNLIYDETHMRGYRNSFNTILEYRGGIEEFSPVVFNDVKWGYLIRFNTISCGW
jgi:hypothetical protein